MPTMAPVSENVGKVPPSLRRTVQAARRMVKSAAPKAKEVAARSRPILGASRSIFKVCRYEVDGTQIVAVGTFPKYVSLYFARGRELDDGSGLLEGAGKQLRYIRLRTPADAERAAVKRIVRKAFRSKAVASRR